MAYMQTVGHRYEDYYTQQLQQYANAYGSAGGISGMTGKVDGKPEKPKKEKSLTYCKRCGEKLVMSDLRTHYDEYTGDTLGKKILGCPNNKGWLSMGHTRFTQDKYGDWVRCETKIDWSRFWNTLLNMFGILIAVGLIGGFCYWLFISA